MKLVFIMGTYRQRPFFEKVRKALFISIYVLFWVVIIETYGTNLSQCYASVNVVNDVSFSLNIESLPLKEACEIIKNETDYKIIFDPTWQDKSITLRLDNVPLSHVLRRIIKMTGIKNYALIQHNNEIKILSFDSVSSDGESSTQELNADLLQNYSSTDVGINLTLADMQALKKKSDEGMKDRSKDAFVTPPSSSGKMLTAEELEALKQANNEEMENIPKNTVVTPPSSSGRGLTVEELEALKQANNEEMENIPKNTVVTPPSSSGRGLKVGELEALKQSNNEYIKRIPKDMIVTPPSESGKGLTLEEIENLQKTHK